MKTKYLILFLIAMLAQFSISQAITCCGTLLEPANGKIQVSRTDDCRVKIKIINPCGGAYSILVDQEIGGAFQSKGIKDFTTAGETYTIFLSPPAGSNVVTWRIRIASTYNYNVPLCADPNNPGYHDGMNQKSGSMTLICCECPDDAELQSWLDIQVVEDPSCIVGGCMVKQTLNIPQDKMSCFKSFTREFSCLNGGQSFPLGATLPDQCIAKGTHFKTTISLLKTDGTTCEIEKWAYACDKGDGDGDGELDELKPCTPDCIDNWERPFKRMQVQMQSCPCKYLVTYTHRDACNGNYQDLQILSMEILNPLACAACGVTPAKVYSHALGSIIALNEMNFDPKLPGDCDDTWRVTGGACWATWTYYISTGIEVMQQVEVWRKCDGDICCLERMKVCRQANNSVTVQVFPQSPPTDCTGETYMNPDTGEIIDCQPVCDWNKELDGNYEKITPLAKGTMESIEQQFNQGLKNIHGIQSSQTNDQLNVNIKTNSGSTVSIDIYDMTGNKVMSNVSNLNSGMNVYSMDLTKLSSGMFMYSVSIDGVQLKSDKIMISK